MVITKPMAIGAGAGALLVAAFGYVRLLPGAVVLQNPQIPSSSPEGDVPEIALERVEHTGPGGPVGRRDIFRYGPPPGQMRSRPVPTPEPEETPPPPSLQEEQQAAERATSLHFVGTVDNKQGLKMAILVTDSNEVLAGKVGDVLMNRFRLESIGLESLQVLDLARGLSLRIPFRGNRTE